jgi:unsaturated chondroitin disaccharide hydrolase
MPPHNRIPGFIVFLTMAVHVHAYCQNLPSLVDHAITYAQSQLEKSVQAFGEPLPYPRSTLPDGSWQVAEAGDWTSGFFPGCLWFMFELRGDSSLRSDAERWMAGLEFQQYNTRTHDVGFIINNSYGNAYRIVCDDHYRQVLLQAAASLSTRYNPSVGCLRSWDWGDWSYPVIIDNMMNLELLFWASKHGGSTTLRDIAVNHALKTMQNHFRPDGSTYHLVNYDPSTGAVVGKGTHQGYSDESVWSRGQAWAIYGFTMAYRETGDTRFLETAERAAQYFLDHLPADNIPYWDFLAPGIPDVDRDVSAAAVSCSALLELSQLAADPTAKIRYFQVAKDLLCILCQPPYLSEGTPSMGVLNHGVGNAPAGKDVDVSLIYADYYFLEAIHRYLMITESTVPITLSRFSAELVFRTGPVRIEWETLSETDNFGFNIQRMCRGEKEFTTLPGAFVAGHGTTIVPQKYVYQDTVESTDDLWYRLQQVDLNGTVHFSEPVQVGAVSSVQDAVPGSFGLEQSYPNPFNAGTTIGYRVSGLGDRVVRLAVCDMLGREVAVLVDERKQPGVYTASWNAAGMASGVYVYRLTANDYTQCKAMVLLK